jgi:ribonuclease BN (tRNA processing enzyme)
MKIIFLGTNGWYDSSVGNTVSTLIDTKEAYIILDAGFGINKASNYLKENKPVYLFLTHFHIDHICGLHTLPKLPIKNILTIISHEGAKELCDTFINHPYATPLKDLKYTVKIQESKEGKNILPIKFECLSLQHIDLSYGYRLYLENKVIVYCSDTKICNNDKIISKNADLLIHECGYNVAPLDDFWGHTDPEGAAQLAKDAKVKKLYLTHFGPNAFPSRAKRLQAQTRARKFFKESFAAFDDQIIEI